MHLKKNREGFKEKNPDYVNPFQEAAPIIIDMIKSFEGADLSKTFKFKLSDFTEVKEEEPSFDPTTGSLPLPQQPMPKPSNCI